MQEAHSFQQHKVYNETFGQLKHVTVQHAEDIIQVPVIQ